MKFLSWLLTNMTTHVQGASKWIDFIQQEMSVFCSSTVMMQNLEYKRKVQP